MPGVMPSIEVLNRTFGDIRARILDVAAALDRLDRAEGGRPALDGDARLVQIGRAIEALLGDQPDRAAEVQRIFSLPYDPAWPRPPGRPRPAAPPPEPEGRPRSARSIPPAPAATAGG